MLALPTDFGAISQAGPAADVGPTVAGHPQGNTDAYPEVSPLNDQVSRGLKIKVACLRLLGGKNPEF